MDIRNSNYTPSEGEVDEIDIHSQLTEAETTSDEQVSRYTLPGDLAARVAEISRDAKLIVVSNREPIIHEATSQGLKLVRPASGMVTALEPIVRAVGGTWIAHGSGSGDKQASDSASRYQFALGNSQYTLRRVWLTKQEEAGYYYGVSNGALWPLCHIVYQRPEFRMSDWQTYREVNEKFTRVILEEANGEPAIVFLQDYQLGLVSRMLRERRPDLTVAQFWHIPWPNREAFRVFPWGEELLDGLLGNDLLGFHVQYHCSNFMETVDRTIESRIDYENNLIRRGGHDTSVRPFPISVDFDQINLESRSQTVAERIEDFRTAIGPVSHECKLFVGADRIDYTKGIIERIKAFKLLLQRHPELCEKVILIQLGAPSRLHLDAYRDLNDRLDDVIDDVNWHFQTDHWQPIHLLRANHDYYAVLASYRMAYVGLATSLHDGMNLVAKEFVAAQHDNKGVLILSRYTGAARELTDALLVNPFNIEELADAMYLACTMPQPEVENRMAKLREQVAKNNVYAWGVKVFDEIGKVLQL